MDLFKILGTVIIRNSEAKEALDDTSKTGKKTQGELSKTFAKIGESLVDAFENKPIEETDDSLKGLSDTVEDQEDRLKDLKKRYTDLYTTHGKNSKEAKQCAKEIEELSGELTENKVTLKKAEEAADKFDKSLKDAGKTADESESKFSRFTAGLGKMVASVGKAVVGLGAAVAAVAAGAAAMVAATEGSREYRTELSKLTNMATTTGTATDYIKNKWMSMSSVLGDSGAVTEGLNNIMAAGYTSEESINSITEILEGAALKWKDTLKFEGLADGLQETFATGKAVGPFAEMLERSGISLETFDEGLAKTTTSAERQQYILNTLSRTGLADVSKSYRAANGDIINAELAQMRLTDTIAKFGAIAEPIITRAKTAFTGFLESLVPFVQQFAENLPGAIEKFQQKIEPARVAIENIKARINEFKQTNSELFEQLSDISVIDIFAAVFNAVATAVSVTIGFLLDVTQWIIDNQELLTNMGIILGAFAGSWLLVNKALAAWTAIVKVATLVTTKWGAAMTFLTSPIGIVIVAIGALIAIIVLCIKYWDEIKAFAIKAWEGIKNAFSSAGQWFNDKVVQPIRNTFTNLWNGVKTAASNAWEGVKNVFSKVGSFFGGIWNTIKTTFSALGTKIADAISGAVRKGINSVITSAENIINGFLKMINNAIEIINNIPGVSISKVKLVSFKKLAEGGVVDEATPAIFGEDGAEAVVPLENNTGWISRVAEQLHKFSLENKNDLTSAVTTWSVELQEQQVSELQMLNGKVDRIITILVQFFPQLLDAFNVKMFLDTGVLVAETAGEMDAELGKIAIKKGRGR